MWFEGPVSVAKLLHYVNEFGIQGLFLDSSFTVITENLNEMGLDPQTIRNVG